MPDCLTMPCLVIEPPAARYAKILEIQLALWSRVVGGDEQVPSAIVLVEHRPVITIGAGADDGSSVPKPELLEALGVEVANIDRGGQATYHGPGQIVAYPILNLQKAGMDVHEYLRQLEDAVIDMLADYSIEGERHGLAGVWVGDKKVCSIGIAVRRWVTYHGLALNVDPNMSHFALIKPCGLAPNQITSMKELLGQAPDFGEVKRRLTNHLCSRLSLEIMSDAVAEPIVRQMLLQCAAEGSRAA